jgi:hypothetical protein
MAQLFAQLGRPNDPSSIEHFIARHRPIDNGIYLHEARFWTASQAIFLFEALRHDAEWSGVVDELNVELHARPASVSNPPDSVD